MFNGLPLPGREPVSYYDCADGAVMALYEDSCREEFEEICNAWNNAGVLLYQANTLEGTPSACFKKEGMTMQMWFCPENGTLRMVADPFTADYTREPTLEKGQVTLWQFEVDHTLIDCGMCYIVKNGAGHFFIVDSAHTYSVHDDERLYDFLRNNTPAGEKIIISGWFFSHGHVDHIGKFMDFLRYCCKGDVEIRGLYYNFVSCYHRDSESWMFADRKFTMDFNALVREYAIPKIKLHTGQHFCVEDLQFDVLCTHEDVWPHSLENYNDSSVVLRMQAGGSVVMFPGDAGHEESDILCARYPALLRCDVMQDAHHGHFGCTAAFYELAAARVVLFPTTQIMFDEDLERYECNRRAIALADRYYIASNGTAEIPLPLDLEKIKVYPDETFEDFEGVFNLWSYEYSTQRKAELYAAYLARGGKPLARMEYLTENTKE